MTDPRDAYDEWHRSHTTGSGPWYGLVWDALERRELLRGARVLEIGCGGGAFAARLADNGAGAVVGQDYSPVAIEHAQTQFQRPNLSFEVGDIQEIAYPTGDFDVVVSCETIEHVPDPRRAIVELARVLNSTGTLLLTTPNYMSLSGLHRLWREATGRGWDEGGQPIVHWTTLPRTVSWLRHSGLSVRRVAGDGWYVPVRHRSEGYALRPPAPARRLMSGVALHQLLEAGHRRPSRRGVGSGCSRGRAYPCASRFSGGSRCTWPCANRPAGTN